MGKKKRKATKLIARIAFLVAVAMIASNNIIQFVQSLGQSYGVALFLFLLFVSIFYSEVVEWFK